MVAGLLLCTAWYFTILSGFFILYCPVIYLMFFSHRLYRKIVDTLFAIWELYPVALFQCCSNTELHHFGDYVNADEKTIIVMNHRTRVDWNYVWIALYHATQNLEHELCTCKQSVDIQGDSNTLDIGGKSKIKFVLKDEIKNIPGMDRGPPEPPINDVVNSSIGAFGKYHWWLCFLIFLNKIPMGWHQMSIIFLAPPVPYTCNETSTENFPCPCTNPVFDTSIFKSTIITRWELICERKPLAAFAQMIIQGGVLIGSIVFGMASDRFGRRPPLIVAVMIQGIAGILASFTSSFFLFNVYRFLIGAAVGGCMVTGFVILLEFIGVKHRPAISALYQVPLNFGHMSLPLISYFLRDYVSYHLAISAPILFLGMYFFVLPETPRWLMAAKRNDEAISLLSKVAKINKFPTEGIKERVMTFQSNINQKELKKGNIFDLFKTPNIRKNSLCMMYQWFTCSFCFYGVCQYISHLTGNIFLNVAISATVVTIGSFLSIPLLQLMKRKPMLIIFQAISSGCFFVLAITPWAIARTIIASLGVVCSFIVFILVYLYGSELFPTVVRSAGIGVSSMSARVGSMIAPFVLDTAGIHKILPPLIFAIVPFFSAFIALLMPETKDRELMTTIQEGWIMQLNFFLYVKRNWQEDQVSLSQFVEYYHKLDYNYRLVLFPEGTDLSDNNSRRSEKFAAANNYENYKYVLHPRTTGWVALCSSLRQSDLASVYDVTIAYDTPAQTEIELIKGRIPMHVYFHCKRYSIDRLPQEDTALRTWLNDRWKEKEHSLRKFHNEGNFVDPESNRPPLCRSPRPLIVAKIGFLFWTLIDVLFLYLLLNSVIFQFWVLYHCLLFIFISWYFGGFQNIQYKLLNKFRL